MHTSAALCRRGQLTGLSKIMPSEPTVWPKYNEVRYEPHPDKRRPAEVTHFIPNIKYSRKKLWYLACLVRGLSIDEAIVQMSFQEKQGSAHIKRALLEAQEKAVNDHNVEFKSNLFVADSFVTKGTTIKGYRKHRAWLTGVIHYRYTHYYVRLREGKPPRHYYKPEETGHVKMDNYIEGLRKRTIIGSL